MSFKIGDGYVEVRLRDNTRGDLEAIRRRLSGLDTDAEVGIDDQTEAGIARIRQRLAGLDRDVNVRLNTSGASAGARGLGGMLGRLFKSLTGQRGLTSFASSLMLVGSAAVATSASIGTLTAAAATLGGALVATGPILVASLGMLGGVLATLKVGTQGLAFAFEALAEGDMKNWGKALKNLSPEAAKFALAIKDVWGALKQSKGAVQDKLFSGMAESVSTLARTELPMLKHGMGSVATELNRAAKETMAYIGSSEGIDRQRTMWRNTATVVSNLRPGLVNLTAAMFDIGDVGSTVLANLTGGSEQAGAGFRKMIAEARQSGELERSMYAGVVVLKQLGSVAGNVGSILTSLFTASRAAGSDFLTTLDRGTESLANFMRTGSGQNALVAFFRESRATIDALVPGLVAAREAISGFVQSFSESGGLRSAGAALSNIATQIRPLAETLGSLTGDALGKLADGASLAASALSPLVSLFSGLVGGMGGLAPTILAAVVAFKALRAASAGMLAVSAGAAASAAKWGLYATALTGSVRAGGAAETATRRLSGAIGAMGRALPFIGVGLIGLAAVYDEFGSKADEVAAKVINGSQTMAQAQAAEIAQVEKNQLWWNSATQQQDAHAAARARVTAEFQKQYDALSPMQQLQADVAMAQAELNDAVVQFGPASSQAAAAAAKKEAADRKLMEAEHGIATAAKSASQAMQEQVGAIQGVLGSVLGLEEALDQAADAEKAANDAAKQYGAESEQATDANRQFAAAADQAAQAAQKQAEWTAQARGAFDPAAEGAKAYGAALLSQAAIASGPAQTALLGYISKLDNAQLAALSAGAEATGFATKILTLPDGRTVKIAIDPETGKIISTQQLLDHMQDKTVTINGNTMPVEQAVARVLSAIALGQGTVTINGKTMPAVEALHQLLGQVDLAKATVTIDGQTAPAKTVYDSLIAAINSKSATVMINGNPVPVQQVLGALIAQITGSTATTNIDGNDALARTKLQALLNTADSAFGTITIDGNPQMANGKITAAVSFADGQTGTITIDANDTPANGKINATVTYADGSTGTITVNANDAAAVAAINRLKQPTSSVHTVKVVYKDSGGRPRTVSNSGGIAGGGYIGYSGGGIARASRGMVIPGYAPGVDDVPAILSRGEAVLVPELVRAIGARNILAANAAASHGRKATVLGRIPGSVMTGLLPKGGYAGGGLVGGNKMTAFSGGGFAGGGLIGGSAASYITDLMAFYDISRKAASLDPETKAGKVAAAEKAVAAALRDETEAQVALNKARQDAIRTVQDLQEKLSDYAIDEEAASIAVARAKERLDAMQHDKGATALDLREANNAYASALERQRDLSHEHALDLQSLADAQANGPDGSDAALSAFERVLDAMVSVVASKVALKKAKKAKDEKDDDDDEEFDSGGLARGRGILTKRTIAPERVLSPQQTADFGRLVDHLTRNGQPGAEVRQPAPITVNVLQQSGSPAETGRYVALALRGVG